MREAIRLAKGSVETGGGPFGAVVVRDGEVVGRGANRVVPDGDPTAHAEVVAIRDACANLASHVLSGCELYTTCEPCPMCLSAIHWARLDRIYFAASRNDAAAVGFDDALLYEQVALPPADRALPMEPLIPGEGAKVLELWAADPDRNPY